MTLDSLDLLNLASFGMLAAQLAMLGLIFWVSRWPLAAFRFERDVLVVVAVAMGPLALLMREAIPLDVEPGDALMVYLNTGVIVLVLQILYWSAFVRLRKRRREEQAILKSAA